MSGKFLFAGVLVAAALAPAGLGIAQDGFGIAQKTRQVHPGPWPIYGWLNHQPTEDEQPVDEVPIVSFASGLRRR